MPKVAAASTVPGTVLHVIVGLGTGGAPMMLVKLIEQCDQQRMVHRVISLMSKGALRYRLDAVETMVDELGLRRGKLSPRAAIRLASICRAQAPDVLQGWMYHGNLAATLGSWSLDGRCPVVWGIRHSILDMSNEKPMTRWLIRLGAPLSRTTAAIVYCSRASARQHERIGYDAGKTVVIPNGFDCDVFHPRPQAGPELREQLHIPADRAIIGHVARFDPMKDYRNLIAAVARLIAADQNVHLVMVGHGVEPPNLELSAMIRRAGIVSRVSLLGERTDVPALMPGFDILALSSSTGEAFPNVLGEAMASGVPCVATDVGDCAWIVGDTGVTVPPRDSAALAFALRSLVDAGREARGRRGQAARARIVENFSLPNVTRSYLSLYERLA